MEAGVATITAMSHKLLILVVLFLYSSALASHCVDAYKHLERLSKTVPGFEVQATYEGDGASRFIAYYNALPKKTVFEGDRVVVVGSKLAPPFAWLVIIHDRCVVVQVQIERVIADKIGSWLQGKDVDDK